MADFQGTQSEISPPTGPSELKGAEQAQFISYWSETERQAVDEKDPKAQALMDLKSRVDAELGRLKDEGDKFQKNLEDYQRGLRRTDTLLMAITVVVVLAFITTLSLVFYDQIKEKDLYTRYNDMYEKYTDKYLDSVNTINVMSKKIIELEKEFELLRARNTFLR